MKGNFERDGFLVLDDLFSDQDLSRFERVIIRISHKQLEELGVQSTVNEPLEVLQWLEMCAPKTFSRSCGQP